MRKGIFLLLYLLVAKVYAEVPPCTIKGGGILDNILLQFANAAVGWHNTIEPITRKFFFILFGVEFMWQLTVKKVFAGDIEKLWVFFFTRTILCFFFARYLVNIEMYRGIIEFFAGIGGKIGGYSLNLVPGSGIDIFSPSAVLSNFSCMADMIHSATDSTGTFDYLTLKLTLAIIQVIIFIVLIFIAYYLMQILLQAYLLIYAGFIFAGFAGSSWTRSYWERYTSAAISVGAKFLVVSLLMGVLNVQMKGWAGEINQAMNSDLTILAAVIFRVCGVAIVISMAIWRLPEWFANALSGQISSHDGGAASSAINMPFRQENFSGKYTSGKGNASDKAIPGLADLAARRNFNNAAGRSNTPNPL